MLGGEEGAYRDTVLLNAGAALVVAGKAKTRDARASQMAAAAIDEGRARDRLERLDRRVEPVAVDPYWISGPPVPGAPSGIRWTKFGSA